ncbi:cAMP phosphodiesterases class-II-domain-containing protein [Aspergillus floccosus]
MPPKKRRVPAEAAEAGPSKKRAGKQTVHEKIESSSPRSEPPQGWEEREASEDKPQFDNEPDEGLQVIVLGSSGGPFEDRTSSFLVRSLSTNWREKSMVAIDAGSLLAGILHVLETSVKGRPGPFSNLPMEGIQTNIGRALHIFRNILGSICLTHPHMDHIAGLIINTQALQNTSSPKTVACLQSVIDALKQYVFNGVLWPNLTDDQGAGLITFHTLIEGGNPMLGSEDLVGYDELCEKLLVKCYKVTHGECTQTYDSTERRWRRRSSVYPHHTHQQPEPA